MFVYDSNQIVWIPSLTATRVLPSNTARVAVLFVGEVQPGDWTIWIDNSVSAAIGIGLDPDAKPLLLHLKTHGPIVQRSWFAFQTDFAARNITISETLETVSLSRSTGNALQPIQCNRIERSIDRLAAAKCKPQIDLVDRSGNESLYDCVRRRCGSR